MDGRPHPDGRAPSAWAARPGGGRRCGRRGRFHYDRHDKDLYTRRSTIRRPICGILVGDATVLRSPGGIDARRARGTPVPTAQLDGDAVRGRRGASHAPRGGLHKMSDQHITCSECGGSFVFSESERKFYEAKGLAAPPKRCKACRRARKAAEGARGGADPKGRWDEASPWAPRAHGPETPAPRGAAGGWGRLGGDGRPRRPSPAQPQNERPERARRQVREVDRDGFRPRRSKTLPAQPPAGKAKRAAPSRPAKKKPERPKFDVTCVQCGAATQVPFKPVEGRDIFCQPCYRARHGVAVTAPIPTEPDETDD